MTRRWGDDYSFSRFSSRISTPPSRTSSSYSSRLISSVSGSQSSYTSSYRNAYRSFPTVSTSPSSSSSYVSSSYSSASSRNYSRNATATSIRNSSESFGTVFRNRPSYSITTTVRSSMDNQFASDVRLQRSINNCIKATTDIGRKTDFLRHEMAQNRLNTLELRERARDLRYRIDTIRSRSGPSYSSWEDYMAQR
ncbi:Oidioi.mRNA.OKI2018_I69.chr2.g5812.t1.cds [Oikopleura dioica]|uniref:Oidioi.mRNA.OKI2018_I69.chr2.g5812.t1.cds n=1 Tax=Oikopleura dioica TaxID=34765 RepID=A0ABN7T1G4_OIKDI|nr:Oidioi.mRNA.OKI2018_I69.chr2.g5812.t1.cds [Oikopleura dioica]